MTEPFIGEIQIYGFSYAPANWALAAGQLMAIRQNTALFALIGTVYGGNGTITFQLPNLASMQACGTGQGPGLTDRVIGEQFGDYAVALTNDTMPAHNHGMNTYFNSPAPTVVPTSTSAIGSNQNFKVYTPPGDTPTPMSPMMIQPTGGGQPHANVQPYLGVTMCIALQGIFPQFN